MTDQTSPLTEQELDEIAARATAATPGPWRNHDTHLGQYGYAATVLSGEGNDTDLHAWLPTMSQTPWDETRNVWADAAFVAAARTDVPALLAEVARLKGQRKYLIGQLAKRDAESGRADEAVRQFLAGEQPAAEGAQR